MIVHRCADLQFPSDMMLSIFSYAYVPSVCHLWCVHLGFFFSHFNLVVHFLTVEV